MADNIAVTAGSGTSIAADDIGAGLLVQRVKATWGPDGTANDTDVATGKPMPVQLRSPTGTDMVGTAGTASAAVLTVQGIASGTAQPASIASGGVASGAFASGAVASGAFASGSIAAGAVAAGASSFVKLEDVASADADAGVPAMAVRKATPANTSGTDGDYEMLQMSAGRLWASSDITLAGTAAAAGSGTTSAATLRTTLATDSAGIITTGTAGSASSQVVTIQGVASMTPIQIADNSGSITVDNGGTFAVQATVAAGATNIAKAEDVASADADVGVPAMVVRKATPANSSGTDGDYEFLQASGGYLWVHGNKGFSNRAFRTTFATLTRPANTTAYAAADSISDNATAGSVTALVSGNISDVNDDPIFISEIHINSTDTGLAGKKLRAYLFNSDPTASTGVGAGDNAAYSQKKAGYVGSFMGYLETGFSDGTVGRLVPCYNETNFTQAGGFITVLPVSGARTLYIQYQAVEAFTPSANSTTIIGTAVGWQGRAV